MSTTPAKKKRRRTADTSIERWTVSDGLLKDAQSKARRQLASKFAVHEEKRIEHARQLMKWNQERHERAMEHRDLQAFSLALRPRLSAVIASWGVRAPLVLTPQRRSQRNASTDFRTIRVGYDGSLRNAEGYRQLAAEVRGMTYHELGHILYTTPIHNLVEMAISNHGWTCAGRGVSDPTQIAEKYHQVWNVLEDQRMEMQMVTESPRLAAYFTVMTMELILPIDDPERFATNYPLVAGRTYLPAKLRREARKAYAALHPTKDLKVLHRIIRSYVTATDAATMMQAVHDFALFLYPHSDDDNVAISVHFDFHAGEAPQFGTPQRTISVNPVEDLDFNDDDAGDTDETDGKSADAESTDVPKSEGHQAGTGESADAQDDEEQDLQDLYAEALHERDKDWQLEHDLQAINEVLNSEPTDGLQKADPGAALSAEDEAQANRLASDIEQAFRVATAEQAPSWQSQQRAGVLEPLRYRTRQPGEVEYFRNFADHGEASRDITVSVILDISASMVSHKAALGISAYACKAGCARLGIPCEVLLFNSGARCFYASNDEVDFPTEINTSGGTVPAHLFRAALTYPREEKLHLVLLMTDGDWQQEEGNDMALYKEENRYSVFFQFEPNILQKLALDFGQEAIDTRNNITNRLAQYHPDETYAIGSLDMIPHILENILASLGAQS